MTVVWIPSPFKVVVKRLVSWVVETGLGEVNVATVVEGSLTFSVVYRVSESATDPRDA